MEIHLADASQRQAAAGGTGAGGAVVRNHSGVTRLVARRAKKNRAPRSLSEDRPHIYDRRVPDGWTRSALAAPNERAALHTDLVAWRSDDNVRGCPANRSKDDACNGARCCVDEPRLDDRHARPFDVRNRRHQSSAPHALPRLPPRMLGSSNRGGGYTIGKTSNEST